MSRRAGHALTWCIIGCAIVATTDSVQAQRRPEPGARIDPLAGIFDRDGDGEISARELEHASESLKRYDRDQDGSVTRNELRQLFQQMRRRMQADRGRRNSRDSDDSRPASGSAAQLERAGLEIGKPLPDVAGYDAEGNRFPIKPNVRGHYAVLVFGCLT